MRLHALAGERHSVAAQPAPVDLLTPAGSGNAEIRGAAPDHAFSMPVVTGFHVRERRKGQRKTPVQASLSAYRKNRQDTRALINMLNSHWIRRNWN